MGDLLAAYGLTGCDTVATYHGIGKGVALKVLRSETLSLFKVAPDDILKMIKCSCDSATPCNSRRCGCQNANMACTSFCTCQGGDGCFNPKTRERIQADDESDHEMNDEGDDDDTDWV